jgi:hypothetical protein
MSEWSSGQMEEVGQTEECTDCDPTAPCPCGAKVKCRMPVAIGRQFYNYSCGPCSILRVTARSINKAGQDEVYDWLEQQPYIRRKKWGSNVPDAENRPFDYQPNDANLGALGDWEVEYYLENRRSKVVTIKQMSEVSEATLVQHLTSGGKVIVGTWKHWMSITAIEEATNNEGETDMRVRLNDSWTGVAMWIPIENIRPGRGTYWIDFCMNRWATAPDSRVREEFEVAIGEEPRAYLTTAFGKEILKVLLVSNSAHAAGGGA